jgi:WD40 repeat protein
VPSFTTSSVTWDPDGTTLAVNSSAGIQLWSTASVMHDSSQLPSGVSQAMAWSPDGSVLAVATGAGTQLWNVTTRQQIGATLGTSSDDVLVWNPDGKTLAIGTNNGQVQIWNLTGLLAADLPAYLCAQAGAGQTISRPEWAREAPGVPYQNVCQ